MQIGSRTYGSFKLTHALVLIYFLTLLFWGKSFTKLHVAGPFYLHDITLFILTGICLFFTPRLRLYFRSILLLMGIALFYLIGSLYWFRQSGELIGIAFRQFAIIIYMACAYLCFSTQVVSYSDLLKPVFLIRLMAHLAFWLQVVYLIYGFFFIDGFSLFNPNDYNYFSPLTVMGIIVYCADALAYPTSMPVKILRFVSGVALSLSLGHSSAFLACFIIGLVYSSIWVKAAQRSLSFAFILMAVLALLFLPQFMDFNSTWRLLYWKHILTRSVIDGYAVLGNGFGGGYMTESYANYIYQVLNSKVMMEQYYPMARHLNPPHNSIFTFVFHVGLLPALLFFVPLRNVAKQLFVKGMPTDNHKTFLLLSLSGSLVWVSFNVILELPHSSVFFWLVFFTTACYYNYFPVEKPSFRPKAYTTPS